MQQYARMATLFFIFGVVIGSFLNVLLFRYNSGRSILGRSCCMSCGYTLTVRELIPIVSFVASFGRCRQCESKISLQYPLVEALTVLLFLGIYFLDLPILALLYMLVATSLLVVLLVYDIHHKIIPDAIVYTFAFMGLFQTVIDFSTLTFHTPSAIAIISGPLLFLPFFLLWFFSRGRFMGLGDAKLALGMGWFLGISQGVLAVMFAFWAGALVGILLIITPMISRKMAMPQSWSFTLKSQIPFAPFLIFAFFITLFFDINLYALILP